MTTPPPESIPDPVFIVEPRNAPSYATYLVVDVTPVRAKPALRLLRTSDLTTAVWVRNFWRRRDFDVWPGELRYLT